MPPRSRIPKGAHVFVDETKAREFIMVATWVGPNELVRARRALRALVPGGRARLHFKKLSDSQRLTALGAIRSLGITVTVSRASGRDEAAKRAEALRAVLAAADRHVAARVVLETDEPMVWRDLTLAHEVNCPCPVVHHRSVEEPLLWVSDAVAWCLQRGGAWPGRVDDLVVAE
ncbi:MAG: hypothetical protein QM572_09655 [Nocardioides sp.]|uniref:hypothetical protein n=1 Tax=Nocardioides sp. TaxID=35761 RepID=UPI0039E5B89D